MSHSISSWSDPGTGYGDEKDGWQCRCGAWGIDPQGIQAHVDSVNAIRRANEALEKEGR